MQKSETYNEEALVEGLKAKNTGAFEELYDRYSGSLYGVILRITGHEPRAQDLLQETFIRVWTHIDHYDPSKGRLYTWMVRIARNKSIDNLRSASVQREGPIQSEEETVAKSGDRLKGRMNIDHIGLKGICNKLADHEKQVIELLYFLGYTQSEAAKKLDLPLGTLKTRARTAIGKLRKWLNSDRSER